jgi:hypothetical protein
MQMRCDVRDAIRSVLLCTTMGFLILQMMDTLQHVDLQLYFRGAIRKFGTFDRVFRPWIRLLG